MEPLLSHLGIILAQHPGASRLSHYVPLLVILSFAIALFGARAFLKMAMQLFSTHEFHRHKPFWALSAAIILGGTAWSMQFTALLAFELDLPVGHDILLTLASLAAPIVLLVAPLHLMARWRQRQNASVWVTGPVGILCGGLIGLCFLVMHLLGMLSLSVEARTVYLPNYFWATVALAIVAGMSAITLGLVFHRRQGRWRWVSAATLASAICAMHYTAMAGTRFLSAAPSQPGTDFMTPPQRILLALGIMAILLTISRLLIYGTAMERQRDLREKELARTDSYLNTVVNSVRFFAIFLVNRDGIIRTWNSGARATFQATANEAVGAHISRFLRNGDALLKEAHQSRRGLNRNLTALRKDGTEFSAHLVMEPVRIDNERQGYGVFVQDLSHMIRTREQMASLRDQARHFRFLANHDPLTGLKNRRAFMEEVRQLTAEATDTTGWIALCDLDHFKKVNDTYGHEAGDRALQVFAQRARSLFGEAIPLGRFGGEEFVAYIPGPRPLVERLIKRLVRVMEEAPVSTESEVIPLTVSIGLSEHLPASAPATPAASTESIQAALKRADTALYYAKEHGRNQAVFYELRVLIVDADLKSAARTKALLNAESPMPVKSLHSRDGLEAILHANRLKPHILFMHRSLPGIDIRRFFAWLKAQHTDMQVVIVGDSPPHGRELPADYLVLPPPVDALTLRSLLAGSVQKLFSLTTVPIEPAAQPRGQNTG
ncbi:diguanylate cyclase domain-containing protein [Mangrovitalea sediminis]|uniref:diguanylate cyclase domain-containing protein n=1 Tax=Mangrovitalea sediminis TaxID=1982043 RepID=UPI000BE518C3|nr:diguanylate cyclase [Mangrovitalea sediminis]